MARAERPSNLVAAALSVTVGAAIVLDAELRVLLATEEAVALLGYDVPVGASAPKLLCGGAPKRPFAEALAEGRPARALLPQASKTGVDRVLEVRSLPLAHAGTKGWLLLLDAAHAHTSEPVNFHGMWARTPRMKEVFRIIERVAAEDVTVLIRGETGTGKELVAQALHQLSPRRNGPFRAINCAALPSNLLESELFGHARGAFTGAVRDTPGHIQLAHRGTLFLDEVAELPLELQAKLLRVLESKSVVPVGGREPIAVDVRIVSATHRALQKEVEAGRFRADLMFRLRVIPIFLPALRERREDIGLLCEKLMEELNATSRRRVERASPAALSMLERYDWPGNVRELRNSLAYAYAIGDGSILSPNDLPPEILDPAFGNVEQITAPVPSVGEGSSPEARRILQVLERTHGNKNRAARILGISRVTLWRHMRALDVKAGSTSRF